MPSRLTELPATGLVVVAHPDNERVARSQADHVGRDYFLHSWCPRDSVYTVDVEWGHPSLGGSYA